MAYGPITSWQIEMENVETVIDFIFSGSKVTIDGDFIHKIKGHLLLERKIMTVLDSILKIRDITFPTVVHIVKTMVFFSSHVWMWELEHKEYWALKHCYFWIVVLEKTLESSLNYEGVKPINPKEINPQYSLERLMLKL